MPYGLSVDTRQPRGKFNEIEDMSMKITQTEIKA